MTKPHQTDWQLLSALEWDAMLSAVEYKLEDSLTGQREIRQSGRKKLDSYHKLAKNSPDRTDPQRLFFETFAFQPTASANDMDSLLKHAKAYGQRALGINADDLSLLPVFRLHEDDESDRGKDLKQQLRQISGGR